MCSELILTLSEFRGRRWYGGFSYARTWPLLPEDTPRLVLIPTCPMNSARRQSSQRNLRRSDLRRSEMGLINFSGVGFKYSLKASANTQCLMLLRFIHTHKPSFIKKCSLVPFANFHIRRRRFNFDGQPWNSWAGFAWPPPFEVCVAKTC